jgi:hypothetical protein
VDLPSSGISGDAWAMSNEYTTSSRAHLTAMESGVRPSGSNCKDRRARGYADKVQSSNTPGASGRNGEKERGG